MIWYKFHIGDYLTHTVHLSDAEDLAYRRLLDLYYMSERTIPLDAVAVSRKIRLDLDITESVLGEFFEKTETGYFNSRCDAEVSKYQSQVAVNRALGKKGGRPKSLVNKGVTKVETESVTESEPNHNPKKIQIQKKNITTSSKFDEFWKMWPASKRKVAKSECEKKWFKLDLDMVAERILWHVSALKKTEQWTSGFDPAPLTYINQRRWEDDDGQQAPARRVI
jgi:uncharacterized protein YdaU (DUF1376 family)